MYIIIIILYQKKKQQMKLSHMCATEFDTVRYCHHLDVHLPHHRHAVSEVGYIKKEQASNML